MTLEEELEKLRELGGYCRAVQDWRGLAIVEDRLDLLEAYAALQDGGWQEWQDWDDFKGSLPE